MKSVHKQDNIMIINALKAQGPMTTEEICMAIYGERRCIRSNMRVLKEGGEIKKTGRIRKRKNEWELK